MDVWEDKDFRRDARFYAELCMVSAGPVEAVRSVMTDKSCTVDLVRVSSLTAVVVGCPDRTVVCFSGTDNWQDVITDSKIVKVDRGIMGRIHTGFIDAWADLRLPILLALKKIDPEKKRPVIVGGHSLGGALAALCSSYLSLNQWQVGRCWTYAMPRVGNCAWKRFFISSGVELLRIVNNQDVVTKLPFFNYFHVGTSVYLDKRGNLRSSRPWTLNLWKRFVGGSEDHFLAEYLKKLSR